MRIYSLIRVPRVVRLLRGIPRLSSLKSPDDDRSIIAALVSVPRSRPAVPGAEIDDVRHVMLSVPLICRQQTIERHESVLRVDELSRIILRRHRAEQSYP